MVFRPGAAGGGLVNARHALSSIVRAPGLLAAFGICLLVAGVGASVRRHRIRAAAARRNRLLWELGERVKELTLLHRATQLQGEADNRMKDAFLATVSHELRRPLTAILGWTRMLRQGGATDTTRALDVIERSATIQLRMIEELLDLSRAATGQLGVSLSSVNLSMILRDVAEAATPAASDRHVEIATMLPDEEIHVRGDGIRLQQVFGNLVANAIKFTPSGGRVAIAMERTDQYVRVEVADTGIGIDPAALPTIFEPFWQADPSTTQSREGLGLGLAIVRRLVELHGGTIEAHSAGIGHGARMIVRLPCSGVTPGSCRRHNG
jgi:signal transduction histidine kinase